MSDIDRLLREYREKTRPARDDSADAWRSLSRRLDTSLATTLAALAKSALVGMIAAFLVCLLGGARLRIEAGRTTGAGGSEGSSGTAGAGGMPGSWAMPGDA